MKNSRLTLIKTIYITVKVLAVFIIILSAIAYYTPIKILNEIYDFERHHFFIFSFISLVVFFMFLKFYLSLTKEEGLLNKKITNIKKTIIERELANNRKELKQDLNISDATVIAKEEIPALTFDKNDLPIRPDELMEIESNLMKAMVLGNSYKQKVKVFFKDVVSLKYVETTVWFVGDKHVTLKEGILLPKNKIYKVII